MTSISEGKHHGFYLPKESDVMKATPEPMNKNGWDLEMSWEYTADEPLNITSKTSDVLFVS